MTGSSTELDQEQSYVDLLYARLDHLRERTAEELGDPPGRPLRHAAEPLRARRLRHAARAPPRPARGGRGPAGLRPARPRPTAGAATSAGSASPTTDQTQLLVDWRAPAARSFYQATAAAPDDVVRRRHLATRGREVDRRRGRGARPRRAWTTPSARTLNGEGALLAAIGAHRTGRMGDIVATIQAEQDRVIRSDLAGVLVVQGGPGTGKTAVALHRAAYLLYTHRERLARSGVLVVGPNRLFLRYIEQVLPSLGETGVVHVDARRSSIPGSTRHGVEEPRGRGAQGRPADGRRGRGRACATGSGCPTTTLQLAGRRPRHRADARGGGDARPGTGPPQPRGRTTWRATGSSARCSTTWPRAGRGAGHDGSTTTTARTCVADLRDSRDVRRELNLRWMPLTPEQLLADLFADPAPAGRGGPHGSAEAERALLHRERGYAVDRRRRAAARRGRRAARRGRHGALLAAPGPGAEQRGPSWSTRAESCRSAAATRSSSGCRGSAAEDLRRRFAAEGPTHDGGRARRARPRLGLRPRGRRRGAGAVGDDVAPAHAALPAAVDDAGRRHRADRLRWPARTRGARCSTPTCRIAGASRS